MTYGTPQPRCWLFKTFTRALIQAVLGWENLSMNRYAHFVEEQRQAVASAMDSILTPVDVKVAVNAKAAKLN